MIRRSSLPVAIAVAGVVALAGCAAPAAEEPLQTIAPTPTSEPTPTSQPESAAPDGTAAAPFAFGVLAATEGSRWNVTITEPVADGTDVVRTENQYNEVKEGWQYVLGRLTAVVNESMPDADAGQPASPLSVMPVFVGSDGKIYDVWNDDNSAVVLSDDWLGQPDIVQQVGVQSSGRFAIQVPSDAVLGGQFGTRNEVSGDMLYFGEPLQ